MIPAETDYQSAISLINNILKNNKLSYYSKQELLKQRSGLKAEKEIAYSLSAYFKNKKDIIVINNLKINHNGVTAQVDHLIISRKAMYFVESKSISDTIDINKYDEWFRIWNDTTTPINSHVLQVERQKEIILQFMNDNLTEFRKKLLGLQGQIKYYPQHVFVAISEKGNITGEGRKKHTKTLMKHDKIPPKIKGLEKTSIGQTIISDKYFLNRNELEALADLLLKSNINKEPVERIYEWITANIPDLVPNISSPEKCTKCNKSTLIIKWGKYGYYFACTSCDNTFSIKESCPACKKTAKIKKDKSSYFLVCPVCGYKELYFSAPKSNKATA